MVISLPIFLAFRQGTISGSPFAFVWSIPSYTNLIELTSPELAGRWDFLVILMALWAVTSLAEEFFFRGVLLPRMAGRAGWAMPPCSAYTISTSPS